MASVRLPSLIATQPSRASWGRKGRTRTATRILLIVWRDTRQQGADMEPVGTGTRWPCDRGGEQRCGRRAAGEVLVEGRLSPPMRWDEVGGALCKQKHLRRCGKEMLAYKMGKVWFIHRGGVRGGSNRQEAARSAMRGRGRAPTRRREGVGPPTRVRCNARYPGPAGGGPLLYRHR